LLTGAALRIAAVILFERDEQKDKSGKPDPAPSRGNAQIKKYLNPYFLVLWELDFRKLKIFKLFLAIFKL
jgi:hypothetical protein